MKTNNLRKTFHFINFRELAEPAVVFISRRERFSWKIYNVKNTLHSRNLRKLAKPVALCISVLFIISMLSVFATTTVQARPTHGHQQPTHTPAPALTPTPTPIPTAPPTPSGNSLMSVTDGNWYTDMQWINVPYPQYSEIIDTTATYDGSPSWQITLNPNGWGVDWCPSGYLRQPIAPGDKIYYSFWIETSVATLSSDVGNPQAGARIGIDFYGPNGQTGIINTENIAATSNQNGATSGSSNTYVKFGTSIWTQMVIEFTVPATYVYSDQFSGQENPAGYVNGENVVPTACIPWIQVYSDLNGIKEGGTAWFADPVFTITPG